MLKLGIIGTGGMARSHATAYRDAENVELVACCDILEERARAFSKTNGFARAYTDWEEMLDKERLDGISVVTPAAQHADISIGALDHGVAVLCEKPMAANLADAKRMLDAWQSAKVVGMINYSKRNAASLQGARDWIEDGQIGEIRHVEASYLQAWLSTSDMGDWRTEPKWTWRLSTRHGSQGVLGDLGCHIYDMAAFLCGDIVEISCRLETFDKGVERIGEYELDANDSMVSTVTFASGVIGSIHSSRWATGYRNREFIRVYGTGGTIEVDLNKSQTEFYRYDPEDKEWLTEERAATPTNYARFVQWVETGEADPADFANGYKVQQYLDASFASDKSRSAVRVEGD